MNSTFRSLWRDESSAHCGELLILAICREKTRRRISRCRSATGDIFAAALPMPQSPLEPASGHAVPTRRVLSARRVELTDTAAAGATLRRPKPSTLPARPHFSSGPCAKPPGWNPALIDTRVARPVAPVGARQGASSGGDRAHARAAATAVRLSARHRPRVRHGRGGDGALVAARPASRHHARLGKLRRRLGHRRAQAAEARSRCPHRRIWRDLRPERHRSRKRRRLHLERHHQRRSRSERRLDRRRPHRPHDLRRDLCRLRPAHRLDEDRCRHLQLAKGAGRRRRAWDARAEPARRRAAGAGARPTARFPRSSA